MSPNHREVLSTISSITGKQEYLKSTNGALNITGSFTPVGTQNVNLTQVGGSSITLGQTTKSASLPVTLASDTGNLPINMTQINGVSTSVGNGITDTGTQRVTISSDSTGQINITDGTNKANILKSDGTAAGQNSQLIAPTGMTTGTLTLNAGSPNTQWFDLLNYSYITAEVLTNTGTIITWQSSGDALQTVASNHGFALSGNVTNSNSNTVQVNVTGNYYAPKTARYFRVSSNASGGNSATVVLTFHTIAPYPVTLGVQAGQSGVWNTSVTGTPTVTTVSVGTGSTSVLASNANRKALIFSNVGANNIFINLAGGTAVATNTLLVPNASVIIDRYAPTTAITGIAATGATNLSVTELV